MSTPYLTSSATHDPSMPSGHASKIEMFQELPDITDLLKFPRQLPQYTTHYSWVYKGDCKGQAVAIKVLRTASDQMHTMRRRVRRERSVWGMLLHENITPLYGYAEDYELYGDFGALVSPWYNHGDAATYIRTLQKDTGGVSFDQLACLWVGVIKGVEYLHSHEPIIIHGDLKPTNVLIDDNLNARICDFGLVQVLLENGHTDMTTTSSYTGTERYLSPELLQNGARPTVKSDIWALGCIGLYFLFQTIPYAEQENNTGGAISASILGGLLPADRPNDIHPSQQVFWQALEQCWLPEPSSRPDASTILEKIMNQWPTASPPPDPMEVDDELDSELSKLEALDLKPYSATLDSVQSGLARVEKLSESANNSDLESNSITHGSIIQRPDIQHGYAHSGTNNSGLQVDLGPPVKPLAITSIPHSPSSAPVPYQPIHRPPEPLLYVHPQTYKFIWVRPGQKIPATHPSNSPQTPLVSAVHPSSAGPAYQPIVATSTAISTPPAQTQASRPPSIANQPLDGQMDAMATESATATSHWVKTVTDINSEEARTIAEAVFPILYSIDHANVTVCMVCGGRAEKRDFSTMFFHLFTRHKTEYDATKGAKGKSNGSSVLPYKERFCRMCKKYREDIPHVLFLCEKASHIASHREAFFSFVAQQPNSPPIPRGSNHDVDAWTKFLASCLEKKYLVDELTKLAWYASEEFKRSNNGSVLCDVLDILRILRW